jgi:hypothetical protein
MIIWTVWIVRLVFSFILTLTLGEKRQIGGALYIKRGKIPKKF